MRGGGAKGEEGVDQGQADDEEGQGEVPEDFDDGFCCFEEDHFFVLLFPLDAIVMCFVVFREVV